MRGGTPEFAKINQGACHNSLHAGVSTLRGETREAFSMKSSACQNSSMYGGAEWYTREARYKNLCACRNNSALQELQFEIHSTDFDVLFKECLRLCLSLCFCVELALLAF